MVQIIRKGALPLPGEVPEAVREAAAVAATIRLREPRPEHFPVLFTEELHLLEAPHLFLHEHAVERAHTTDTLRTYAEILYDWFDTLEQNRIVWSDAGAADLVAYRNRMLLETSAHTRAALQHSNDQPPCARRVAFLCVGGAYRLARSLAVNRPGERFRCCPSASGGARRPAG